MNNTRPTPSHTLPFDVETAVRLAIRPARTPALSLPWAGGTLHFDANLELLGWQADESDEMPDMTPDMPTDMTPPQTLC